MEVRTVNLERDGVDALVALLSGVDVVISTIEWNQLDLQRKLVDAAKRAGVKRFVPSDFATACVPGIMKLHDEVNSPASGILGGC